MLDKLATSGTIRANPGENWQIEALIDLHGIFLRGGLLSTEALIRSAIESGRNELALNAKNSNSAFKSQSTEVIPECVPYTNKIGFESRTGNVVSLFRRKAKR